MAGVWESPWVSLDVVHRQKNAGSFRNFHSLEFPVLGAVPRQKSVVDG